MNLAYFIHWRCHVMEIKERTRISTDVTIDCGIFIEAVHTFPSGSTQIQIIRQMTDSIRQQVGFGNDGYLESSDSRTNRLLFDVFDMDNVNSSINFLNIFSNPTTGLYLHL